MFQKVRGEVPLSLYYVSATRCITPAPTLKLVKMIKDHVIYIESTEYRSKK
jgi:hypothetical protein